MALLIPRVDPGDVLAARVDAGRADALDLAAFDRAYSPDCGECEACGRYGSLSMHDEAGMICRGGCCSAPDVPSPLECDWCEAPRAADVPLCPACSASAAMCEHPECGRDTPRWRKSSPMWPSDQLVLREIRVARGAWAKRRICPDCDLREQRQADLDGDDARPESCAGIA